MVRQVETVTLHFDLSHLTHLGVHQEFTLKTLGKRRLLKRHDEETRRRHVRQNRALAALPGGQRERITHYAEDVELPADAVGFHWVGYPSSRRGTVSDEIAVVFQHVPSEYVRRCVRAMSRDGGLGVPGMLSNYGVHEVDDASDPEELHVDASNFINYISTALTIIMQHPEIGTLAPDLHYRIAQKLVVTDSNFADVWQYLSTHPAEGEDPWYENTHVVDPAGNVMQPDPNLTDKDGQPVVWPTTTVNGKTVSVIPQHRLSDDLNSVLKPAVQTIGKTVKQCPWLKGQQWSTQHGVTQLSRTHVAPGPTATAATAVSAGLPTTDWTIVNKSSHYGLDLDQNSIQFDSTSNTLSFNVKNWPNRGLGAYVQFLDPSDRPISDPTGWQDRLSSVSTNLRNWLEPNSTKWYLQYIGAGSVFFGAPVWAPETSISFVVPTDAAGANILIGGLGNGDWDLDVDKVGLIYTCVVSYGIPSVLSVLSVGVQSTKWYMEFFDKAENVFKLVAVAIGPFAYMLELGTKYLGVEQTLIPAAQFVVGIIFSSLLQALALKITGYTTMMELSENAPFVGWALRVASVASAIADMLATSVEVGLCPATYTLEAKRSITLNVIVSPDPTHGTKTQKPIWPEVSDHYVIMVQYKGGTTLTKTGPMPGQADAPISVTYATATEDALPAAPRLQFQIVADIYSASNWLCGKWVSGWIDAVPTDGDSRTEVGSIIEQLVPLTASTTYSHEAKLNYDGPSRTYVWEKTLFSISDDLEPFFVPGPAPAVVRDAFWANGVRLSTDVAIVASSSGGSWQVVDEGMGITYDVIKRPITVNGQIVGYELSVGNITEPAPPQTVTSLQNQDVQQLVDVTLNNLAYKLGYCYLAQNQNLPEDYGTTDESSAMFVFESISTLAEPGNGMLAPTCGFSLQPDISYDQFGPAGLFPLQPAANYQPELDGGGNVPADIAAIFANEGFPLDDGAQVTVKQPGAVWQIGDSDQPPAYDLRREVDVIFVFRSPAPTFSPNNFYLDSRTYSIDGASRLRLVDLGDGSGTFDYGATQSWGAFGLANLNAIAVHPNGFAVGISYEDDKLMIVKLPPAAVDDHDAPQGLPFSGSGTREGLMRGPVALTISADGRILVLEAINARIQAFDTQGNPVQCFASPLAFTLSSGCAADLNSGTVSTALLQALQINVPVNNAGPNVYEPRYLLTPLFSMPESFIAVLSAGTITQDLQAQFESSALTLAPGAAILETVPGNIWLLQDVVSGVNYDIRFNGEGLNEVDVYRCFTPTTFVKAANSEWLIMDKTNTLSFDVTAELGHNTLHVQNLTSVMPLKDGPAEVVTYLDVAVESKGFIYVLSYVNDGANPSDYRLDVYNPDGTPVNPDIASHNGEVNGARMTVDQWRTVFTLNYQQMQGPGGRPEPTVSQWIPSTPSGS